MADWDTDSPQLAANTDSVMALLEGQATKRVKPTLTLIKAWHAGTMTGLTVPNPAFVASFRGEKGVELVGVMIGGVRGVHPSNVKAELAVFEKALQKNVAQLDKACPPGTPLDVTGFSAVIDLAAWAHSEWVRIHAFANGNGRTARFLANFIFFRYDIGPVVRVRPRPGGDYEKAAAECMKKNHAPMASVFVRMIAAFSSQKALAKAKLANAGGARKKK